MNLNKTYSNNRIIYNCLLLLVLCLITVFGDYIGDIFTVAIITPRVISFLLIENESFSFEIWSVQGKIFTFVISICYYGLLMALGKFFHNVSKLRIIVIICSHFLVSLIIAFYSLCQWQN